MSPHARKLDKKDKSGFHLLPEICLLLLFQLFDCELIFICLATCTEIGLYIYYVHIHAIFYDITWRPPTLKNENWLSNITVILPKSSISLFSEITHISLLPLNKSSFKLFLVHFICVYAYFPCMYVCMYTCACLVPTEARRGYELLGDCRYRQWLQWATK